MAIPGIAPYPMPAEDALPANIAPWTPTPGRAALLVHDMQRYFVAPFPREEQPARSLLANTARLVRRCRALGVPVVYTAQPGDMTGEQRGLLKDFWGPGMRTSPEHQRIIDEVAPDGDSSVFTKWRYSAFHNSGLMEHLREVHRDQLIVCGVYAHVGCLMTAVEAFTNDIETFIVADAVADFSAAHHYSALEYAAAKCAVVLPTDTVLTRLEQPVPAGRG
ncbi:isochorismatase family protein [Streptomyces sp. SID2888]|uniref:isochorismatase family protein n=1 Tax=Streptomyces sp. SID2888 TaxID=2690256 RepID=UPI00136A4F70|nr:isochorismatase family protein [Streptomyces sp. SID2888]MYV49626.1 isochorismatase family protein [Streptomyces sp. SID2888]